ncbi:L-rhamnose mutarotase [Devosia rhizoryzae]|uniref:L-rhamnose mutarotase n=1 Tax=Devosia rhizoryzae TaxID=2774137 RepID=A0ABX7C2H5_9HYPH|nr:L-rhamnose mutarotase [Devosia rhizoryzae]QQR38430.1 L-rhamnose mutarotase [Devosia rhizoryzae]
MTKINSAATGAFVLKVKPGMADEYRRRHDSLWPEMRQALLDQGIIYYEIYFHGDSGLLFAHTIRSGPYDAKESEAPAITRWRAHMRDIMELEDDGPAYRRVLERIFLLDAQE